MSDESGIDKARAARKRQEELLRDVTLQRSEVRDIEERAITLRRQNKFGALVTMAMRGTS